MVSSIELRKSLSKLMIPLTLFENFNSYTFITSIKVFYMTTHSRKSYKLRNIVHSAGHNRDDVEHRHPKRENLQY